MAYQKHEPKQILPMPSNQIFNDNLQNNTIPQEQIGLRSQEGILFIKISDIVYCKADGNYTLFIMVTGEKIMVCETLKKYEEVLSDSFYRIHYSYLINLNYLKKYKKAGGGVVVMQNDDEITVSRRRKEPFLNLLKLNNII